MFVYLYLYGEKTRGNASGLRFIYTSVLVFTGVCDALVIWADWVAVYADLMKSDAYDVTLAVLLTWVALASL